LENTFIFRKIRRYKQKLSETDCKNIPEHISGKLVKKCQLVLYVKISAGIPDFNQESRREYFI